MPDEPSFALDAPHRLFSRAPLGMLRWVKPDFMSMSDKRTKKYFIATYGCQMNKADSEKIAGAMEQGGYKPAKIVKDADLVIINTCSVRQSAEDRVLGLVNNLLKLKEQRAKRKIKNCKLKIIVTGCMLRYTSHRLKKMLPGVDEFVKLKDLISPILNSPTSPPAGGFGRQGKFNSESIIHDSKFVKIMEGCNNFCTYCVVPYARGREKSRPMDEIYCEVKELVKRGCKEIALLGQNVNSYGKGLKIEDCKFNENCKLRIENLKKDYKNPFALLLALLHSIKELKKIKFLTSNPQDLTDDIIKAMKLPKIDRYLHLPVQSGDDEILKKMNRKYTTKKYLALIKKIRKEIVGISIGTDIIVGFPGESKKQFQNTVKLCKKAGFKTAYIAKYSPRIGTAAYELEDNVPYQEKKRRWEILDDLINKKEVNG